MTLPDESRDEIGKSQEIWNVITTVKAHAEIKIR